MRLYILIFGFLLSCSEPSRVAITSGENYANELSYCMLATYNLIESDIKFPAPNNQHLTIYLLEKLHSSISKITFNPKNNVQQELMSMGKEFQIRLAEHLGYLKEISKYNLTTDMVKNRGKNMEKMDEVTTRIGKFIQDHRDEIIR